MRSSANAGARSPDCCTPVWSVVAAGASAGIAVVVFLATQWPGDLAVFPLLVAWSVVLSAVSGPAGWRRPTRLLLLVGVSAIGLGGLAIAALAVLVP